MKTEHQVSQERSQVDHAQSSSSHLVKSEEAYESAKKMSAISKAIGYVGIIIGVISLFFYPYVLGVIGIILGFISMKLGEIVISSWAIGICALSIILSIFVVPLL